jgi:Na+-driven multidrug efflux pump
MSLVLIPPYGASGAAAASAIGYAAGGIAAWICFVRLARQVSPAGAPESSRTWKSTEST